jgi:hypothetical protein
MKTLKFTAYLFYRYYSKHGFAKEMPYLSTITILGLLLYIHIFQILAILDVAYLIPTDGSQLKIGNYVKIGLFMLPMFLLFYFLIKKEDLINARYEEKKIKKGYVILIIYIVLSFALLMILALIRKGKI